MPDVLATLRTAGVTLEIAGDKLVARPRSAVTDELCTLIRDNKAAIMAELSRDWSAMPTAVLLRAARDAGMRICVSDTGDGRMILYDVESGGPAGLWDEIGSRSGEILAPAPEEADMARLSALDDMERPSLPGVSPEFAARLSAEDRADIAAGDIPVEQVVAFETAAIAREARNLQVILKHDAKLPSAEAELETARLAVAYARNNGYLWSSLRLALADYPVLVPDMPGKVDSLSLGLARLAVLKDKRVVRQGTFSGAQEVKA